VRKARRFFSSAPFQLVGNGARHRFRGSELNRVVRNVEHCAKLGVGANVADGCTNAIVVSADIQVFGLDVDGPDCLHFGRGVVGVGVTCGLRHLCPLCDSREVGALLLVDLGEVQRFIGAERDIGALLERDGRVVARSAGRLEKDNEAAAVVLERDDITRSR
jgi:hypothetical protein